MIFVLSACNAPGFLVSRVTIIRKVQSSFLAGVRPNPAPVGYPVTFTTAHSDVDGINHVDVFVNGKLVMQERPGLGEQSEFRIDHMFTPPEPGEYHLKIMAYPINPVVGTAELTATFMANNESMPEVSMASIPDRSGGKVACINEATLLDDVPIPNNGDIQPGEDFSKTWRINNSGTCDWRAGYTFDLISGPALSAKTLDIPHVGMRGNVDITLNMTAPDEAGGYRSSWRLFDADGVAFGEPYHVDITVPKTCQNPDIRLFAAQPAAINAGEPSLLQWDVQGAKEISIEPGGTQTTGVASNLAVFPNQTTVYTLVARDGDCASSQQFTVTVFPQTCSSITINKFEADPATIYPGEQSTLTWRVTGATSVSIAPATEVSTAANSLTVAPLETTVYSLTAENATCRITRNTTVTVRQTATLIDFIAVANNAVWQSDSGPITFNDAPRTEIPADLSAPYALWRNNIILQNGQTVARTLEINPSAHTFVRGRYPFDLADGTKPTDVVQIQLAYRAGVTAANDATYSIIFIPTGQSPILLGTFSMDPDGVPLTAALPLTNVPAGSYGEFLLQANKGTLSTGDAVAWLSAVLIRP